WSFDLELLLQARKQLGRPEAQRAALVELCRVAVGWAEPRDRLEPSLFERTPFDARAQPAAAVQEVIALLRQHLAQTMLEHLDRRGARGPVGVAQAEQLLVVGQA